MEDAFGKLLREKLEKLWSHLQQYVHRNLPCASLTQQTHSTVNQLLLLNIDLKGPPSSKSHCHCLLFWISLLPKRVIWLAERTQAVWKGCHLILYSSASNNLIYKYTPNMYKTAQKNYRMINRERIYTGGWKYNLCAGSDCNEKRWWQILEVFWKFRVTSNSDLPSAKHNAFWENVGL